MSQESSKERARWEQAKDALMSAVRDGDAKRASGAMERVKGASLGSRGAERGELFEKALMMAIRSKGEGAVAVCEAILRDGAGPGLGWRRALSNWQFSQTEEDAVRARAMVEAFMRAGAKADWEDGWEPRSGDGETPLWSVCHYPNGQPKRSLEIAEFLLDRGANPNHLNGAGESALWGCLRPASFEYDDDLSGKLTALLLRRGADPRVGERGVIPLEELKDPSWEGALKKGASEALLAWAEAEELREAAPDQGRADKSAFRKGL